MTERGICEADLGKDTVTAQMHKTRTILLQGESVRLTRVDLVNKKKNRKEAD